MAQVSDQDLSYAEYLVTNNRRELAYTSLNQIIAQHPNWHRAYYLRAINYLGDNNLKSSMQDINLAIRQNPRNACYLGLKSQILYKMGKTATAAETMEKAIGIDEAYPYSDLDTKLAAAEILASSGNTIDALPIINSIDQRTARYLLVKGITYVQADMTAEAISELSNALDMQPSLYEAYIWRGLAYYKSGDRDKAHSDWNTAIRNHQYKAKEYLYKYR